MAVLVHPQSELIREPRLLVPGMQPLGPVRASEKGLALQLKYWVMPTKRAGLTFSGDAKVESGAFSFAGVNGYVEDTSAVSVGTGANTTDCSFLSVHLLSSFSSANAFQYCWNAKTSNSSKSRYLFYSNNAGYDDCVVAGNNPRAFSITGSGISLLQTVHAFVVSISSSGIPEVACNGKSLLAGSVSGLLDITSKVRLGCEAGGTDFEWTGKIWLFAQFGSYISPSSAIELSNDPFSIFNPA